MLCDPLTPIVMDTNYMNKCFYNTSCGSNNDVFQSLRTRKSEFYLRLISMLIEKGLHMDMLMNSA